MPGMSTAGSTRRGQHQPGGQTGAVADAAVVAGASGAGLNQGGGRGQQRDDRSGDQRAEASLGANDGEKPHPDRQGSGGGGQREGGPHEAGAGESAGEVGHGLAGPRQRRQRRAPPAAPIPRPRRPSTRQGGEQQG